MSWRALVPIKPVAMRKTRLATHLSSPQRARLTHAMLLHVLLTLEQTAEVDETTLLGEEPIVGWNGRRIGDGGRGLNAELHHAAQLIGAPMLVVHGDLPLLCSDDITALLSVAGSDGAVAPDRHDVGTNALAVCEPVRFRFAFGSDSFSRHSAALGAGSIAVRRIGLAMDVDEPADLQAVASAMHLMQCESQVKDIVTSTAGLIGL